MLVREVRKTVRISSENFTPKGRDAADLETHITLRLEISCRETLKRKVTN